MVEYVLFFLGLMIIVFLLTVSIQLSRIERNFKDLYFYTERKVKLFFEQEEEPE